MPAASPTPATAIPAETRALPTTRFRVWTVSMTWRLSHTACQIFAKSLRNSCVRPRSPRFQRAALQNTELGGVQIEKGQRLVLFYRSANFDDEVFERRYDFDVLRSPNPHVGFGGTGAHYCIGAKSSFINGIKHWRVDYSALVPSRRIRCQ
jgi:hypothetical protein